MATDVAARGLDIAELPAVVVAGRDAERVCQYVGTYAPGGNGADPAEIAQSTPNLSAALRSRETVWRLDNRLWLGLAQGTDRRAALKFDLECAISAGSVEP